MTKREEVWRCIKNAGYSIRPAEIAEALELSRQAVRSHLRSLRLNHEFITEGNGKFVSYLVPAGGTYAGDGRGKSPGSRASRRNWPSEKGCVASARAARERREDWGGPHKITRAPPTRLTDLDRCWANVVNSPMRAQR